VTGQGLIVVNQGRVDLDWI